MTTLTQNLTPQALIATHDASDEWVTLSAPLPHWLVGADEDVHEEYGRQLMAYHACASQLETHLSRVLPAFDDYVRAQLAARMKADLMCDIEPDSLIIDLPKSVWRDYDIDPQFARVTNYAAPWVAGRERERFSLPALAKRNFLADDEQMARRLDFADIEIEGAVLPAGLSGRWLQRIIPQLDVAKGYLLTLREVFDVPPRDTEDGQRRQDLLLEPYERQVVLQAFCERARGRLSEEGHRMLTLAAQSRSVLETDAAHLEMNWLQFKPGTAVSGESQSHELAGLCMIRNRLTDRALIYLPDAPAGMVLIEATDPQQAKTPCLDVAAPVADQCTQRIRPDVGAPQAKQRHRADVLSCGSELSAGPRRSDQRSGRLGRRTQRGPGLQGRPTGRWPAGCRQHGVEHTGRGILVGARRCIHRRAGASGPSRCQGSGGGIGDTELRAQAVRRL